MDPKNEEEYIDDEELDGDDGDFDDETYAGEESEDEGLPVGTEIERSGRNPRYSRQKANGPMINTGSLIDNVEGNVLNGTHYFLAMGVAAAADTTGIVLNFFLPGLGGIITDIVTLAAIGPLFLIHISGGVVFDSTKLLAVAKNASGELLPVANALPFMTWTVYKINRPDNNIVTKASSMLGKK